MQTGLIQHFGLEQQPAELKQTVVTPAVKFEMCIILKLKLVYCLKIGLTAAIYVYA